VQTTSSGIVFSPHDLMTFLSSEYAAWMDRLYFELRRNSSYPFCLDLPREDFEPDAETPELELVKRRGIAHEAAYVGQIEQTEDACRITGKTQFADTIAAMQAGRAVIYQGELRFEQFAGLPDFLVKTPGPSKLGDWHYVPRDTKLSRSVKPEHVIQLCTYAFMLEGLQGVRPTEMQFILGDRSLVSLPVDHYFFYFEQLFEAFICFQDTFDPRSVPNVGLARDFGRWSTVAEALLERCDHVSRTARITLTQIQRLETAGITTMSQLAACKAAVPRIQPQMLERLKRQASLQIASQGKDKPAFEIVTPPADDPGRGLALLPLLSAADIFFDMEGFPITEGGLEYLFGAVTLENGKLVFHDWWAHDELQERIAFEQFVDWAHACWKNNPLLHIYHYAAYETAALRRLMGKHASRESKVDDLLRNNVFVDLYTVVRQGLLIGTTGYSLKDIECLCAPPRTGTVTTAGGSMVAYQAWIDSGESPDWRESVILKEIRDYNEIDCRSLWYLQRWLVELQKDHGIQYIPPDSLSGSSQESGTKEVAERPSATLAEKLLKEVATGSLKNEKRSERQTLLAWLLEFHWREAKPVFWRKFDRHEMTEQELVDDLDCLGGLERTKKPPQEYTYEYRFDPEQDTKLREGSDCLFAHDLTRKCRIAEFDDEDGRIAVTLPKRHEAPPTRLSLIPNEFVSADIIAAAVYRYVEAWSRGTSLSRAVDDLLDRHPPRIERHINGPLVDPKRELLPQLIDVATRLDRTTLCIQGPPGTGKTYASGEVIAELLKRGKRIGVTALSHKAILNVLRSATEAMDRRGMNADIYKVVSSGEAEAEDTLVQTGRITTMKSRDGADICAGRDPFVVGGTAWFFSRPELAGELDYLIIDEAGQFSLANVVGVGLAARNLILVGDQMQLTQPVQGTHPGESGVSGLDYLLNGKATVPLEFGVLLNRTYRLHPDVCSLVSAATYDGRLEPDPTTAKRWILPGKKTDLLARGTGIHFLSVTHTGNSQCSDEEIDYIEQLMAELLASQFVDNKKREHRKLELNDILVVAPYNMQVARLKRRLGAGARVGSVDKFQGQEAPVVIVSMCASSLDDCPRGAEFLLNPNRLNVAISRAKCLVIVVACPDLLSPRCSTLKQMELTNLFCRIHSSAGMQCTQVR
jgi:predicted RecB family nuclease